MYVDVNLHMWVYNSISHKEKYMIEVFFYLRRRKIITSFKQKRLCLLVWKGSMEPRCSSNHTFKVKLFKSFCTPSIYNLFMEQYLNYFYLLEHIRVSNLSIQLVVLKDWIHEKLGVFWSWLVATRVSCHIEELWYNETVCMWMSLSIYMYFTLFSFSFFSSFFNTYLSSLAPLLFTNSSRLISLCRFLGQKV